MLREIVAELGGRQVVLMDSISQVGPDDDGKVVVSGSHGGRSSGELASRRPLAAVFFNDAGVGKEDAGIASLSMLDGLGTPAGTVAHDSARIGDARDSWECGVLSRVNDAGRALGLREGLPLRRAIEEALTAVG